MLKSESRQIIRQYMHEQGDPDAWLQLHCSSAAQPVQQSFTGRILKPANQHNDNWSVSSVIAIASKEDFTLEFNCTEGL